jgi:hypothetical protein
MLSKDSIYILDDRKESILHTHDIIDLVQVNGLKDEGEYKEGSCIRLIISEHKNYILCFDNSIEKRKWVDYIYLWHPRLKPEGE